MTTPQPSLGFWEVVLAILVAIWISRCTSDEGNDLKLYPLECSSYSPTQGTCASRKAGKMIRIVVNTTTQTLRYVDELSSIRTFTDCNIIDRNNWDCKHPVFTISVRDGVVTDPVDPDSPEVFVSYWKWKLAEQDIVSGHRAQDWFTPNKPAAKPL
jgi:hypothetical protein